MQYPKPLLAGSTIGITAFSSGIAPQHLSRFECVTKHLESLGFNLVIGNCLFDKGKHVSGTATELADELMSMLLDDHIDAIYPPWGGEVAMELLPLIDFEKLTTVRPKWILGFSDVSTISAVFASKLDWATAHCSNLMDLSPNAIDPLTSSTIANLGTPLGESFIQTEQTHYASRWPDFVNAPESGLNLDTPTQWRWLNQPKSGNTVEGRLIGGCWDTLSHLFGTEYLDLDAFANRFPEGVVLYLENAEMPPTEVVRTLLSMKFRGVFSNISALLIGRNAAPDSGNPNDLGYYEALETHLKELDIPVMIDLDIGHRPPNLTLINGCKARIDLTDTLGTLTQTLS
ncbi:S66 family peptidase [Vibrio maritimus]|uniref:S66 family peptidase n=1 Tax=Vibrio maritimus TaxID=990268 RepID=UPI001F468D17|nr:S66 peptidase family protein [Vibrio maritimus]